MRQHESGLWIAETFNVLRFRARHRTVTLDSGERAKVWIDDSGTVRQVEHGDHLDATVRPRAIRLALRPVTPANPVGGFARPRPIRTLITPRRFR
jgi:hypothetical protein